MKTIISKDEVTNYRDIAISFVILFTSFILGIYLIEYVVEYNPSYKYIQDWYSLVAGTLVFVLAPVFGIYIRELIFEGNTLTVFEHHLLIPFFPQVRKEFDWDNVIAWDETPVANDLRGKDPFSIDLLFRDGDEIRLYRTPGSWIFVDKKRIRFAEFKLQIKPYLEKIPQDPGWVEEYQHDTTNLGYGTRYLGIFLLIVSLLAMSAGTSLAVMGVFFAFGMFPIAEKHIKQGAKIRKRIAARQQTEG